MHIPKEGRAQRRIYIYIYICIYMRIKTPREHPSQIPKQPKLSPLSRASREWPPRTSQNATIYIYMASLPCGKACGARPAADSWGGAESNTKVLLAIKTDPLKVA